jgi:hypothetical protein
MNGINVLRMIALVVKVKTREAKSAPVVLGTCFAFRRPTSFLTAHHVVAEHDPSTLAIGLVSKTDFTLGLVGVGELRPVAGIHLHPAADVAILDVPDTGDGIIEPVPAIVPDLHLGETFAAFGFPTTLVEGESGGTMHRTLMGHYQRFMTFESFRKYRYFAGEMNVPTLVGMSGSPLVNPNTYLVSGLAAESIDVESMPALIAETTRDGVTERYTEKALIRFGVAVILGSVRDWINEYIPR